jgi:hypothetical protein
LDAVRLPKFPVPSSTPLSPRCRHPDRLHAVATPGNHVVHLDFTTALRNYAVLLLLYHRDHVIASPDCLQHHRRRRRAQKLRRPLGHHRCRVHTARPSPPCPGTAPSSRMSPPPDPHCPAITVAPGNHTVLPVVTAAGSTLPGCDCCPVHASPTSSTCSSLANSLPL